MPGSDAGSGQGSPGALEIVRSFRAPPREVFNAWTSPRELAGWWGPEGFLVPPERAEVHLEPGGSYRGCMVDPAGGEELWWRGTFTEVRPPSHLSFSLQWEPDGGAPGPVSTVELIWQEHDGGTRQTFREGPFTEIRARESSEAGWREAFDRLALLLGREQEQAP